MTDYKYLLSPNIYCLSYDSFGELTNFSAGGESLKEQKSDVSKTRRRRWHFVSYRSNTYGFTAFHCVLCISLFIKTFDNKTEGWEDGQSDLISDIRGGQNLFSLSVGRTGIEVTSRYVEKAARPSFVLFFIYFFFFIFQRCSRLRKFDN